MGPVDPMNASNASNAKISVSFLMNEASDAYESFALRILSALLIDGPSSPFYLALIESGLGLFESLLLLNNVSRKRLQSQYKL